MKLGRLPETDGVYQAIVTTALTRPTFSVADSVPSNILPRPNSAPISFAR
jgi:hypothetical protein